MTPAPHATPTPPATARQCGECSLCCKLGEIEGFKPFNAWCRHCTTHKGCDIYNERPQICRDFYCHYLRSDIAAYWQPLASSMIISAYTNPQRFVIAVDPQTPDRWREAPYFADIRHWSQQAHVTIMVGYQAYAVYPNRIEDLGEVTNEYRILFLERETAGAVTRQARRMLITEIDEAANAFHRGEA